jgi:hypothetical protein
MVCQPHAVELVSSFNHWYCVTSISDQTLAGGDPVVPVQYCQCHITCSCHNSDFMHAAAADVSAVPLMDNVAMVKDHVASDDLERFHIQHHTSIVLRTSSAALWLLGSVMPSSSYLQQQHSATTSRAACDAAGRMRATYCCMYSNAGEPMWLQCVCACVISNHVLLRFVAKLLVYRWTDVQRVLQCLVLFHQLISSLGANVLVDAGVKHLRHSRSRRGVSVTAASSLAVAAAGRALMRMVCSRGI